MKNRTEDLTYSQDYWDSLDGGMGYNDGVAWEDLACAIKETFGYSWPDKREDLSLQTTVIDVGCAMGYLVRHLRRRDMLKTYGGDISPYAIDQAPEDVRPYLFQHDLVKDMLPSVKAEEIYGWDLIICLETLEHIEEEDVPQALDHLKRGLTEDGMALLSICTDEVPNHDSDPTHVCIKPRGWWAERLAEAGLEQAQPQRLAALRNWRFFKNHPGLFLVRAS